MCDSHPPMTNQHVVSAELQKETEAMDESNDVQILEKEIAYLTDLINRGNREKRCNTTRNRTYNKGTDLFSSQNERFAIKSNVCKPIWNKNQYSINRTVSSSKQENASRGSQRSSLYSWSKSVESLKLPDNRKSDPVKPILSKQTNIGGQSVALRQNAIVKKTQKPSTMIKNKPFAEVVDSSMKTQHVRSRVVRLSKEPVNRHSTAAPAAVKEHSLNQKSASSVRQACEVSDKSRALANTGPHVRDTTKSLDNKTRMFSVVKNLQDTTTPVTCRSASKTVDLATSPTLVRAGLQIIEEIEKLNKVLAQIEGGSSKSAAKTRQVKTAALGKGSVGPVKGKIVVPATKSVPTKVISTKVLNHTGKGLGSSHRNLEKKASYASTSGTEKNSKPVICSTSINTKRMVNPAPNQAKPKAECRRTSSAPASTSVTHVSPYKLIRTASHSSEGAPNEPKAKSTAVKPLSDQTTPSPISRTQSSVRKTLFPACSAPSNISALTHVPSTGSTPSGKASSEMKALLAELSVVDSAFRSARVQTSKKLVKRALWTRQSLMRRRRRSGEGVACPPRQGQLRQGEARLSPGKWSPQVRRRSWSRSSPHGSTTKSPRARNRTKTENQWRSRFSLKKKNSPNVMETLSVNQLLGRSVHNVSSNKYKFIKAGNNRALASQSSPKVRNHLQTSPAVRLSINRVKVDRRARPKKGTSQRTPTDKKGNQKVRGSGDLYPTITSRTAARGSAFKKGHSKFRSRTVAVRGIKFRITGNGLALRKVDQGQKERRVSGFGNSFYRKKASSNLIRNTSTAIKSTANRFIYRSIATVKTKKIHKERQFCIFFNRFGKCNRGDKCPYIHDPDKVAVCTRFLRGTCKVTNCPFSHQVAPEKMPVCTHFLRGTCSRDNCPYRHVKVSADAELCQDFIRGYCPLADKCRKKHSRVCPEVSLPGGCTKGPACRLHHPTRNRKRRLSMRQKPRQQLDPKSAAKDTQCDDTCSQQPRSKMMRGIDRRESEDERHLPMKQRHLPAFIALSSDSSTCEDSSRLDGSDFVSGDDSLQIHPNLSSDVSSLDGKR